MVDIDGRVRDLLPLEVESAFFIHHNQLETVIARNMVERQREVKSAMHRRKKGTLRSGRSGKKVTSRKQAIAIGLSKARKKGARVPAKRS